MSFFHMFYQSDFVIGLNDNKAHLSYQATDAFHWRLFGKS